MFHRDPFPKDISFQLFLDMVPSSLEDREAEIRRWAKPLRDLLFIKLWAATMPEMEKACRKHQNGKFEAPGIKE